MSTPFVSLLFPWGNQRRCASSALFKSCTNCACCFLRYGFRNGFIKEFLAVTHSVNSIWVRVPCAVKRPVQCPRMRLFSKSNSQRRYGSVFVTVKWVANPSFVYSINRPSWMTCVLLKSLRQRLYRFTQSTVSQTD